MKLKVVLLSILFVFTAISVAHAQKPYVVAYDGGDLELSSDRPGFEPLNTPTENNEISAMYTVKEGDNLHDIALAHNIPLDSLMDWNDLSDDLIHPEDELLIKNESILEISTYDTEETADVEKEITVTATAYTAYCYGCSGTTAYGIDLRANPNEKVIAVDPTVIPLGTKVLVEGYGEAIAGDTGGAIKGNRIDIFIPSYDDAIDFGVKELTVKILD